ncbi:MAG: 7-cyano-7-deazaguanine synthase QueC [Planctomycetaceae bacterium]
MTKTAVALVSGGLDSATVVAIARSEGFEVTALSFDYGQRHRFELEAATKVCKANEVKNHIVYRLDTAVFTGSALTDGADVPKGRSGDEMEAGIPITYVPARNTVFLSVGLGLAESMDAFDIFIGVNAVDYSGYPDCRPEFVKSFEEMANLATKAGVEGTGRFRIHTPLISLTKAEIIRTGLELGVDYGLTHSCYDPVGDVSCGRCDSCQLRLKGFEEAGAVDPIPYVD